MIPAAAGEGPRILVIEDEAIVGMELEERLTELGYRVSGPASSYDEAVSLAEAGPPDLVLADIRIAGPRDGIETVKALRRRWDIPAVFVTAHSDAETLGRAVESAQFGYLTKPFRERELHATIDMALYRHRVEKELAERERQLLEAQRLGKVGSWVWDIESDGAVASPELGRILGIDPAAFRQGATARFFDHVHPADRETVREAMERSMRSGGAVRFDFRVMLPNGEVRFVEASSEAQRDAAGRPARILGVARDVTEIRQAEEESRLLQKVALAVGEAPDFEKAVRLALGEVCETTGWVYGEAWVPALPGTVDAPRLILSRAWHAAVPEMKAFYEASRATVLCEGEGLPGQAWAGRKPVVIGDVQADATFLRSVLARAMGLGTGLAIPILAADDVVAVMAFFLAENRELDPRKVEVVMAVAAQLAGLIQRKRATDELLEVSRELQAVFEALPDLFFHVDAGGRILGFKAGRSEDLLLDAADFLGKPGEAVLPPAVSQAIGQAIRESLAQRAIVTVEYPLTVRGEEAEFEARIAPYGENEAVALVRNITERKRAERALREREEQLREASKLESLGRLAGGIAHDFNNLLTVILGYAELIDEEPASATDGLDEIRRAAQRARDLTQQMLAFARRQLVVPQVIGLNEQVLGFERLLRRAIGEDVALRVELAGGLWPVKADPAQVEQVLLNLALNARDAMPGGGELIVRTANVERFEDSAVEPGPYVCLEMHDNGTGMAPQTLEHIFEPFFTTKSVGEGTGLGLATVYGIVKQHNGHIRVESEPGRGTTFRMYFPRATGAPPGLAVAPEPQPWPGQETVLVVEDEPAVLRVTVRALRSAGYTVLTAGGGPEALQAAAAVDRLDLLVSDVVMPHMRGPEVAKALRERWPGLPVLFVSGYAREDPDSPAAAELGPILAKPFTNAALLGEVRRLLDERARAAPG